LPRQADIRYVIEDYPDLHHAFAARGTTHFDRTAAERTGSDRRGPHDVEKCLHRAIAAHREQEGR
jgi:hypothetical protein